jgi:hypothetical protein
MYIAPLTHWHQPLKTSASFITTKQRTGATNVEAIEQPLPKIFNHPAMQWFGKLEHTEFENNMTWITPLSVPFLHLPLDNEKDRWSLFARDAMALSVGIGIFFTVKQMAHKTYSAMGLFQGSQLARDKGNFIAYAVAHAIALLHSGFTAMWFGRWADKMLVHPEDPTVPVDQRIKQSLLNSKPVKWLQRLKAGNQHPAFQPTNNTHTLGKGITVSQGSSWQQPAPSTPTETKQRSGSAVIPKEASTVKFTERWLSNLKSFFGTTKWSFAQKMSNFFIAVPIIPALRWHQYVTPDQKLSKEEAQQKRLELAARDASTFLGGNLLFLGVAVTVSTLLDHRYPQLPLNYRQNLSSVAADVTKTLNSGIVAVLLSKWLAAKTQQTEATKKQ